MNPPVRDEGHREGIWRGLTQGIVDVTRAPDHAPHTLEEKQNATYPNTPSGMTGVQDAGPGDARSHQ